MRHPLLAAATLLLFGSASELPRASAQPQVPGGGGQRPSFSPYLNLLGGSGNPGLNYLGLVRPQQQLNQQFNQLQQQLTTQNATINDAIQSSQDSLLPTGNVSVFNSYGGYFNRIPGITSGGSSGGISSGFNRPLGAFAGGGGVGGGGVGNQSFGRSGGSRGGSRR